MTNEHDPTCEELKRRLADAEAALDVFRQREAETETRDAHIKQVLLAIRNVNQLIVRESDPKRLIDKACVNLTETLGYHNAWIALLDEDGKAGLTASSGFNGGFSVMEERLDQGQFSTCMRQALGQDHTVVVKDPVISCADCPLSHGYGGRAGMTHRLSHEGKIYGILSVSVPAAYAFDPEEQELLDELADDLGFALHKIATEDQVHRLTRIVQTLPHPMSFISRDYRYLAVSDVYAAFYDVPKEEIVGRTAADFFGEAVFEKKIRPQLDRCLTGETVRYQHQFEFPDNHLRWMAMEYHPYRNEKGDIVAVISYGIDISDQRHAQESLRRSEELFRKFFETSINYSYMISPEGVIMDVNPAALNALGYERDELVGQPLSMIYARESQGRRMEVFEKWKGNGLVQNEELVIQTKSGDRRTVLLNASHVLDPGGQILHSVSVQTDITDRKRADAALRESELRYRTVADFTHDWETWVAPDGSLVYCSPSVCELTGYSAEEMKDTPGLLESLIHPDDREGVVSHLQQELSDTSQVFEVDFRLIAKDGRERWVSHCCTPIHDDRKRFLGRRGSTRDITARKMAELRLRQTLDATTDGIWYWHFPTSQLTFGPRYYTMLGYLPDEFPPTFENWLDLIHPEDRPSALSVAEEYLQTRPDHYENEFRLRTKGGEYRWIQSRARVVERSPQGDAVLMIGNHEDITDRKLAQEALRKSETKLRAMFDAAPLAIVLLDRNGIVLDSNEEHAARFHLTREELLGMCVWDVTPPSVLTNRKRRVDRVFETGEPVSGEDRRGDVWSEYFIHPAVWDERGQVDAVIVTVLDVTLRKRGEEALAESERQKGLILNATSEMVAYYDLELRVIWANRAAEESVGAVNGELAGRHCYEIWARRSDPCPDCPVLKARDTREPQETDRETPDGRCWHVRGFPVIDEVGKLVALAEFTQDITERKRADERFRRSQAMLTRTERIAHVGSWEWEIAGDVVTWSEELFRIHGLDPGKGAPNWAQHPALYHPEDFQPLREVAEKAISDGTPYELELRALRKDGAPRICLARGFAEMGPDGKAVRLYGSVQDITEPKRAEEEKERLEGQFRQAQKLESVGRLAGGVAHDFNNMLGVIIANAESAEMDIGADQPVHKNILEILNASQRAAETVRQLLAFARKQTISPTILDLDDTISGALNMLRRLIGEDITLRWIPGKALGRVRMDSAQIYQMLANLVVNSRDAMPDGGTITIETANKVVDESYASRHNGFRAGDYVVLTVSDTGVGMSQEVLEQIFDPFFTTKEVGKGTGLGFPMIYGSVKQNDGFIYVYSEPGEGTTVKIYLPRCKEEPATPDHPVQATPPQGKETVLVAEDEESLLLACGTALERQGYSVLTAERPEEALALAEQHDGEIHLLVTDVVMPNMSGPELWKRLKETRPAIRCLFMSGYTMNVVARQDIVDKGVHFIEKPFSFKGLADKVREVLDT